jgi:hypothetical protein
MMEAKAVLAFDSAFICFSFPNLGVEFARIYNSITMSHKSDFYRVQLCSYFKTVLEVAKTVSIGGLSDRNCGIFVGRDEGEGLHRRRPSPTAPRPVGQSSVSSPLKERGECPQRVPQPYFRKSRRSTQWACVPLDILCGSAMRHTGPSAKRLQSIRIHSDVPRFSSMTKLTR